MGEDSNPVIGPINLSKEENKPQENIIKDQVSKEVRKEVNEWGKRWMKKIFLVHKKPVFFGNKDNNNLKRSKNYNTGCSLIVVFYFRRFKNIPDSGLSLFSLSVSVCTHTMQVELKRCSRTGRVQKNHKILRKNTIFNEHPAEKLSLHLCDLWQGFLLELPKPCHKAPWLFCTVLFFVLLLVFVICLVILKFYKYY